MNSFSIFRPLAGLACLMAVFVAQADEDRLSLDDAETLAVQRQPLLQALDAKAAAARAQSVAAGELPDPTLNFGLKDLPIQGDARYTLNGDNFTMLTLGIRQEFPLLEKRRLRRELAAQEAQVEETERSAAERSIARETGLAWIEVWRAEALRKLSQESLAEAERQLQSASIAFTTNRAPQAEVLAARVEVDALRDQADGYAQAASRFRDRLARWIGEAATLPLSEELPHIALPETQALIAALSTHPHLLADAKRVRMAETDIALAKQDYRPDWAVSAGYGYRTDFADFVGVQIEIPLPLFTARRQDQRLQAAIATQASQEATLEDALREQTARIHEYANELRHLSARLDRFGQSLLPQAEQRTAAALNSYRAGSGSLKDVLDARRATLELAMQQLELLTDAAKQEVQLHYFAP